MINIEIKARVSDFRRKCVLAESLAGLPPKRIVQRDTFFPCPMGRLKLRHFSPTSGLLIAYSRADLTGVKRSEYILCETSTPGLLERTLSAAFGVGVTVFKTRHLYLVGQTRIHLDEVEGLGTFLELEVVLEPGQSEEAGQEIARKIMRAMEVEESDLIACAYADLIPVASGG